jgi:hypothetical protein
MCFLVQWKERIYQLKYHALILTRLYIWWLKRIGLILMTAFYNNNRLLCITVPMILLIPTSLILAFHLAVIQTLHPAHLNNYLLPLYQLNLPLYPFPPLLPLPSQTRSLFSTPILPAQGPPSNYSTSLFPVPKTPILPAQRPLTKPLIALELCAHTIPS